VIRPGYDGDVPPGATVIEAPTPYVWIIGRTQTNGPNDYAAVNAFQDGMRITPLAGATEQILDTTVDTTTEPLRLVNGMTAADYFGYAAQCLTVNPPHLTDHSVLARPPLPRRHRHSPRTADIGVGPLKDIRHTYVCTPVETQEGICGPCAATCHTHSLMGHWARGRQAPDPHRIHGHDGGGPNGPHVRPVVIDKPSRAWPSAPVSAGGGGGRCGAAAGRGIAVVGRRWRGRE
jgi:hypothetical protein